MIIYTENPKNVTAQVDECFRVLNLQHPGAESPYLVLVLWQQRLTKSFRLREIKWLIQDHTVLRMKFILSISLLNYSVL